MEAGIILFVRLVLYRKPCQNSMLPDPTHPVADLEGLPAPAETKCNILSEEICRVILRDTFSVVLAIWSSLQLIWVTMLLIVQSLQIARGLTTYESMRGNTHHGSQASAAITSALTAGSTNLSDAQLTDTGVGPNPALPKGPHRHHHKEGCFSQWKKLLGLDTFVATATGSLEGGRSRRRGNPFSRGVVVNCRDFWCDPAPYFGQRENGAAMLGGDVVNYTRMYETPPRMKFRRPQQDADGGVYHSVGDDDAV